MRRIWSDMVPAPPLPRQQANDTCPPALCSKRDAPRQGGGAAEAAAGAGDGVCAGQPLCREAQPAGLWVWVRPRGQRGRRMRASEALWRHGMQASQPVAGRAHAASSARWLPKGATSGGGECTLCGAGQHPTACHAASHPCNPHAALPPPPPLQSLLRCRWGTGQTFELAFILRVAIGVASALEHMHYRSVRGRCCLPAAATASGRRCPHVPPPTQ